jgi:hypothetical protein
MVRVCVISSGSAVWQRASSSCCARLFATVLAAAQAEIAAISEGEAGEVRVGAFDSACARLLDLPRGVARCGLRHVPLLRRIYVERPNSKQVTRAVAGLEVSLRRVLLDRDKHSKKHLGWSGASCEGGLQCT